MLLEIIVAAVCLQNRDYVSHDGCPSALQAYYLANPRLGQLVKEQEHYVRAMPYGNSMITYIVIPGYTVFGAKRFAMPITKNFSVVTNFADKRMTLEYTFPF
jgi:hypothetical protein